MGKQQTQKKVKVVGTEQFINTATGEVEDFQVTKIEDRDFNFYKVWMRNFISTLDIVGNQKTRLCFWIIDNLDKENKLCKTYRQIADESKISLDTVRVTMKILLESDFLRKINSGCYIVNPDVLYKGTRNGRMGILTQYTDAGAKKKQPSTQEQIDMISTSIKQLTKTLENLNNQLNVLQAQKDIEDKTAQTTVQQSA